MSYKVWVYPVNKKPNILDEFYQKIQKSARAKVARQLKYLEEYGLTTAVIDLKKLRGYEFWEIRILGKENIRIIVWGYEKNIFVIHMFVKKRQSTSLKDLALAKNRLKVVWKIIGYLD